MNQNNIGKYSKGAMSEFGWGFYIWRTGRDRTMRITRYLGTLEKAVV